MSGIVRQHQSGARNWGVRQGALQALQPSLRPWGFPFLLLLVVFRAFGAPNGTTLRLPRAHQILQRVAAKTLHNALTECLELLGGCFDFSFCLAFTSKPGQGPAGKHGKLCVFQIVSEYFRMLVDAMGST